jgi:hypothetical protein
MTEPPNTHAMMHLVGRSNPYSYVFGRVSAEWRIFLLYRHCITPNQSAPYGPIALVPPTPLETMEVCYGY